MFTTPSNLSPITSATPVAPVDAYMLDSNSTDYGVYSLKRESTAYTGPLIRIRRESDNIEVDIDSDDGNGISVTSTVSNPSSNSFTNLTDFAVTGNEDCIVTKVYDQSGNGYDLELWEGTAFADNPHFMIAGALIQTSVDGYSTYPSPVIRFATTGAVNEGRLRCNTYAGIDCNNLTAFNIVNLAATAGLDGYLVSFAPSSYWSHLSGAIRWTSQYIRSDQHFTGSKYFGVQSSRDIMCCSILDMSDSLAELHVDRRSAGTTAIISTHTTTGIVIGGESKSLTSDVANIDWAGLYLFDLIADAGRDAIFDDYINAFWNFAPLASELSTTSLPMDFGYQVVLHDLLASFSLADVTAPTGFLTYDATGLTNLQKQEVYWMLSRDGDNDRTGRGQQECGEPKHFVKDDGSGSGWDGYGSYTTTYYPTSYNGASNYNMGMTNAFWYELNVAGLTNPLQGDARVARRTFVITAIEAIKYAEAIYTGVASVSWGDRVDFFGAVLFVFARGVKVMDDAGLLSAAQQDACLALCDFFVRRAITKGAHDINTNMDMKLVAGTTAAYAAFPTETAFKARCVEAAKKVLFGYTDGSVTKLDSLNGTYYLEGAIREADGPSANYEGRAMDHLSEGRFLVWGEADWDFLDDVLEGINYKLKHLRMHSPKAPSDDPLLTTTSSGGAVIGDSYSNRVHDAIGIQGSPWQQLMQSQIGTDGYFWLTTSKFGAKRVMPASTEVDSAITQRMNAQSGEFVNDYVKNPVAFAVKEPWPAILPYGNISGWWTACDTRVTDDSWKPPMHPDVNTTHSVVLPTAANVALLDDPTDPHNQVGQWWSRKGVDTGRYFSHVTEGVFFSGTYGGRYSGTILGMGAMDQGPIIASFREKKGASYDWDEVHLMRVSHVWGYTEVTGVDYAFNWSRCNGSSVLANADARTITWSDTGNGTQTILTPMDSGGQENSTFATTLTCQVQFAGTASGMDTTITIADGASHTCKEIWYRLPICETGRYSASNTPDDFTVEYKDDDDLAWTASPVDGATLFTARYVRLGIDWGSGLKYSYVDYGANKSCKYLAPITTKDNVRAGLLDVDIHPNSGTETAFPTGALVTVIWTVNDPS